MSPDALPAVALTITSDSLPAEPLFLPGQRYPLKATARDSTGRDVGDVVPSWSTTDATVGEVSPTGVLRLVRPGLVFVTARYRDITGTIGLRVEAPTGSIALSRDSATLVLTGTTQLSVLLRDDRGRTLPPRPLTWSSSDPSVGLVTSDGLVRASAVGRFVVRVSRESVMDSAVFQVVTPRFRQLAAGLAFTCGLATTDEAFCWGSNNAGQLGRGSTFPVSDVAQDIVPAPVEGGHRFRQIFAGAEHACGLKADGRTWCWGRNAEGQLGDGTRLHRLTPALVLGGAVFDTLVLGQISSCGLTAQGVALCWGDNRAGQTGTGNAIDLTPAPVLGGIRFSALTTTIATLRYGQWHTCGLDTGGKAWCWGRNFFGQLGDSTQAILGDQSDAPWGHGTPGPVAGNHTFTTITAGAEFTCGILTSGERACWGSDSSSTAGGGVQPANALVPVILQDGRTWVSLHAGIAHTCGTITGGTVLCWGSNAQGALGQTFLLFTSATPLSVGGIGMAQLTTAGTRNCGITSLGYAACWGGGTNVVVHVPGQKP